MSSDLTQMGLSLLWSIIAVITLFVSSKYQNRSTWLVGAGLFLLVLLKLLFFDLATSATFTRIISFVGSGLLMLGIGFISPIPEKKISPAANAS
jgi:uncharacterized membrane protein